MPSLFRSLGGVLCLAFALSFAAPNAQADSFTPVFNTSTCFNRLGPCPLPIAPDVTFPSPTTIDVTFAGLSQVVAIPSGDAPGDTYSWIAYAFPATQFISFTLVDTTNGEGFYVCGGSSGESNNSCGQLTFTVATATPEPSSLAFMLSGVGLVFAMRRRTGHDRPLAT
jgi:hypothetical protein